MNVVVIKSRLVVLLLEIENVDSLLSDRSNVPLSFINRITAFWAVDYFIHIAATVQLICIKMIESKLASTQLADAANVWVSIPMLFYLNHSSSHLHFSSMAQH